MLDRIRDATLAEAFDGLFPRDDPANTRFSINFFTSIGKILYRIMYVLNFYTSIHKFHYFRLGWFDRRFKSTFKVQSIKKDHGSKGFFIFLFVIIKLFLKFKFLGLVRLRR